MTISKGTLPEQTLATYKIAMSLDSFTEENFGSEILHGAIQENATEFKVSCIEKWESKKPRLISWFNNGETPSVELLGGRMLLFNKVPHNYKANSISAKGLGFKMETWRAGLFINRMIPGENGFIIEQEFKYFDGDGSEIQHQNYSMSNILNNCERVDWTINQTNIPNSKYFINGKGLIMTNFIYEDCPIDVDLMTIQENLSKTHKECKINMVFKDGDKSYDVKKVKHRVFNKQDELISSYKEFNKFSEVLSFKYGGETLEFDVYYEHRLMRAHDSLKYKKFEKRIRKHIEYSVKGKRKGAPLYSVVGPQEIILSCKDAHSGWYSGFDYDKFQGLEIFLVPRQDMKKYYNAVKTNGYSNLKLENTLEISLVEFINSSKKFISPYYDKSKKAEDSLGEQFRDLITDKKEGKLLRFNYSDICGTKAKNMEDIGNWELRKTPEFLEGDILYDGDTIKLWWELQEKTSDKRHLSELVSRIMRHRKEYNYFFWTADKHTMIRELGKLLTDIDWQDDDVVKKVFLITNDQLLSGFDEDEIIYTYDINKIKNN